MYLSGEHSVKVHTLPCVKTYVQTPGFSPGVGKLHEWWARAISLFLFPPRERKGREGGRERRERIEIAIGNMGGWLKKIRCTLFL